MAALEASGNRRLIDVRSRLVLSPRGGASARQLRAKTLPPYIPVLQVGVDWKVWGHIDALSGLQNGSPTVSRSWENRVRSIPLPSKSANVEPRGAGQALKRVAEEKPLYPKTYFSARLTKKPVRNLFLTFVLGEEGEDAVSDNTFQLFDGP